MPELQGRFPIRVELTDLTKRRFRSHSHRTARVAHKTIRSVDADRRSVKVEFYHLKQLMHSLDMLLM